MNIDLDYFLSNADNIHLSTDGFSYQYNLSGTNNEGTNEVFKTMLERALNNESEFVIRFRVKDDLDVLEYFKLTANIKEKEPTALLDKMIFKFTKLLNKKFPSVKPLVKHKLELISGDEKNTSISRKSRIITNSFLRYANLNGKVHCKFNPYVF